MEPMCWPKPGQLYYAGVLMPTGSGVNHLQDVSSHSSLNQ